MTDLKPSATAGAKARTVMLALILVVLTGEHCTQAQVKSTGPVSQELLDLVKEYEEYVGSQRPVADFAPTDSSLRVDSGFVLIDATAMESGEELLSELVLHGLTNGTAYGRMVSGWYPISSVAVAPELKHLKFMRAAQMATGVGASVGPDTLEQPVQLRPSYPNPFRQTANILLVASSATPVRLGIYDVTGRLLHVMVEGIIPAGHHALSWRPTTHAAGLYFARLEAGSINTMQPLVLVK